MACVGHSVIPTRIRSWRCSCARNICRETPVFAGKVTCGVRNETSGQSWPSNTVAADQFTEQNRNSKCGSGIQHNRLGGWQPKTLYLPFQTLRHIGMAARRAIIRAGASTHPLLQATSDMGRTRWILILCAWTIVGLLFAVRRIVLVKVQGIPVSWEIAGALELVYWYVWAAYTPLVIGLAKRFPLTGPRLVLHIAIHTITSLTMAPLASVTDYFVSLGLLRFVFHITGPGVLQFLSPLGTGVLFMSFTGML